MDLEEMIAELRSLAESWKISLIALNKSPQTLSSYTRAVADYLAWCEKAGITDPVTKLSVQKFTAHTLQNGSEPTTARLRHYAIKSFFKWLLIEGETTADPFLGLSPPRMNSKVVPSLSEDQIAAIIGSCRGGKFVDRRDEAVFRFMVETGARAGEVVNMGLADIDVVAMKAIIVKGKGGKGRVVPFSSATAAAVDRYLRARRKIVATGHDRLWVTARKGTPVQYQTLVETMKKRSESVGVPGFHLHRTRHTAATRWLRQGGSEGGLMAIAGWSSRAMIDRYAGASAAERAVEESKGLNLGF
jgi:integrase/recombinase XerD